MGQGNDNGTGVYVVDLWQMKLIESFESSQLINGCLKGR